MHTPRTPAALALGLVGLLAACEADRRSEVRDHVPPPLVVEESAYAISLEVELDEVEPRDGHGLHNVYVLSDAVVSGSEPSGEESFRELQSMGIRTILSVDGKVPNQELAERYGMTYVHVPIQYRSITDDELLRIAKTFREKETPIYVHCFHGKHRGPAAAEVGRLVIDGISREEALAEMHRGGTSKSYEGLYRVIAEGRIPTADQTESYAWSFPAAHAFEGFRQAMVEVSRIENHLELLSFNAWTPSAEHPDVDAVNEAVRLVSALQRSIEVDQVQERPADFQGWMDDAVNASVELRDALQAWRSGSGTEDAIDDAYEALSTSCTSCHAAYRND